MEVIPKKSLGQNFLVDRNVLETIVKFGEIREDDIVIEVGPGTGNLTKKILEKKPKSLTVIEKDEKLAELLKSKFDQNIKIVKKDVLKVDFNDYLDDKKVIIFGNLPYNISTKILINWIRNNNLEHFCKKLILMFQKEVADRIIATDNSKNYSRISIISNWKFNITKIIDISPESFFPKPKIKSSLLLLKPKKNTYKINNPKNLEYITNVFFNQKRKMIKRPMKLLFKDFNKISNNLSLNLNLRPHNLSMLTYYKICSQYEKLIK